MLPAMYKKVFYTLITVISLFAASANGAPMAYSVNSDGQVPATFDSLYLIDLAVSGSEERVGPLFSGSPTYDHFDTEGLALSPGGILWGVDDDSRILFPINTSNATINFLEIIPLPQEIPAGGGNDFGMTFTCNNTLYLTSVTDNPTLYRINEGEPSEIVGSPGALGANISAIAAIGNPARLYGLGNGLDESDRTDSPNLYSIDTETGVATSIGPLTNALPYHQGGLAFDAEGKLWAITDRSGLDNQPSQILSINIDTGLATVVSTTNETGFESLAITSPANCSTVNPVEYVDPYHRIPTLGPLGLLGMIFGLFFAASFVLRRRTS